MCRTVQRQNGHLITLVSLRRTILRAGHLCFVPRTHAVLDVRSRTCMTDGWRLRMARSAPEYVDCDNRNLLRWQKQAFPDQRCFCTRCLQSNCAHRQAQACQSVCKSGLRACSDSLSTIWLWGFHCFALCAPTSPGLGRRRHAALLINCELYVIIVASVFVFSLSYMD